MSWKWVLPVSPLRCAYAASSSRTWATRRKKPGTLTAVNDDATGFTVRIPVKVKEPGAKRPVVRDEEITLPVADVKYVRYEITF